MVEENSQFQLKGRIWIEIGGETFIGEGKARLLKRTAELGSLRKASLELGISYRQAWYSMNRLNKAGAKPVILLHRGGKDGGKALITEFGEKILFLFEKSQYEFDVFLKNQAFFLNEQI
jgi:molybdate transport system regulatory protein